MFSYRLKCTLGYSAYNASDTDKNKFLQYLYVQLLNKCIWGVNSPIYYIGFFLRSWIYKCVNDFQNRSLIIYIYYILYMLLYYISLVYGLLIKNLRAEPQRVRPRGVRGAVSPSTDEYPAGSSSAEQPPMEWGLGVKH